MSFYDRSAAQVARDLVGCTVFRRFDDELLAGRIVETEAYVGEEDRACHASAGRTQRNAMMFGAPGHAYVFFIYGMYDMLNVVCQPAGRPEAVLLRALEPLEGIETMRRLRGVRRDVDIANGPGKLCCAIAVTRDLNGADLRGPDLWISPRRLRAGESLATSARVGVDYAGRDALLPLRFYIENNAHVSRGRPADGRRRTRSRS
ncbi:MAG: DNA-3-methyladenine glycosylase [Candidatus Krumholzibacteriia bacterium]